MATTKLPELHPDHIRSLVEGRRPRPHATLGQHAYGDGFIIRVIRPLAVSVTAILADGTTVPLTHLDSGLWHGVYSGDGQAYTIDTSYDGVPSWIAEDPYRFVPSVGEIDLYLWG